MYDQSQMGAGDGSQGPAAAPDIKEMRSVVLTGFGNLSKVKVYKSPQPMVGPGEVLIRVQACGLNFNDLLVRQGSIDNLPNTPLILGYECAGYVEELGEFGTRFWLQLSARICISCIPWMVA